MYQPDWFAKEIHSDANVKCAYTIFGITGISFGLKPISAKSICGLSVSRTFASEMKITVKMIGLTYDKVYILLLNIVLLLSGRRPSNDIPVRLWHSANGRSTVEIVEREREYGAIVFHQTNTGSICPIEYPLVLIFIGMYIQGEGCIIVAYPKEKEQLFLSPGKGIFAVGIYVSVYRQKFPVG